MSKQIAIPQAPAQPLQAGQKQVIKIAKGQHLRVQDVIAGVAKDASNVVATKQGAHLRLRFADGTELQVENFYQECAGNACSITVAGQDSGGHVLHADAPTGAAAQEGGELVYAHGEQNSLMAMAGSDAGLSAALSPLGEGVVSYVPSSSSGLGWSEILGTAAGGAAIAAAGGGGSGAAAAPVAGPVAVALAGSFVAGPVVDGHGLVATAYATDGTVLGTAELADDGTFFLDLDDGYTGAVLVVVTDGTEGADYWDEATGAPKDLSVEMLRAVAYVSGGGIVNVNVNVFTEAAVRELEAALEVDLAELTLADAQLGSQEIAAQIAAANKKVTDALGLLEDLVTGAAPVAVVDNTGGANPDANPYGKLLAAASGVDEAGDTEATIAQLRQAINAENPVLATSIELLAGASNVVDQVPGFLTQAQMSLNDYFFIADTVNALREELAGALEVGDFRTIKELSDQLKTVAASVTALEQALGEGSVSEQIKAAIGAPANPEAAEGDDDYQATGLYLLIETSIGTAIGELEQKIQGEGVAAEDFTTLAALRALIGSPANPEAEEGDADYEATGLYAVIGSSAGNLAAEIGLANTAAEGEESNATGLYLLIETSIGTAIGELEQKIQGEGVAAEDFTTLAALRALIGSPANPEAEEGDADYEATGLYALIGSSAGNLDSLQSQVADILARLAALEAAPADWAEFDGENAANAYTVAEIFGEGATGSTVLNTFVSNFATRIEGYDPATVPLAVTGDLTVAQAVALAQAGLAVNTDKLSYSIRDAYTTIESALTNPAANAAMAGAAEVVAYGNSNPNEVDMMAFGPDINLRIESGAGADTVSTGAGDQTVYAAMGSDTIWLTPTEDDTSADTVVYQTIYEGQTLPVSTLTFSDDAGHYRGGSVLSVQVNGQSYSYTAQSSDSIAAVLAGLAAAIEGSVDVRGVVVRDNVLEIFGEPGVRLRVVTDSGSPDAITDIANPGALTRWSVEFSDVAADYPDNQSLGGTFTFDRQVHITIAGTPVSASIVYDEVSGDADPEATLLALKAAIEAQMEGDGALAGVLGSVSIQANANESDVVLVLDGAVVPSTDADAPSFSVGSAAIDVAGRQQQTTLSFSNDNADYYDGGTLSVTVAGQRIEAGMVAGDAAASVQNLLQAVKEAEEGVTTGVFQFDHDLEATSVLNQTANWHARYSITLKIGDVVYQKAALFDSADEATTVAGVVDELNVAFAGVAVFTLDAANDRINVRTTAGNTIKAADGLNTATIFLAVDGQYDGSERPAPGESFVSSVNQVPPNPALEGLLETVAQSVAGAIESSQVQAGGDNSAWTYAIGEDGPFLLAEAGVAFGTLPGYQFTIDSNLPRIPGSYLDATQNDVELPSNYVRFDSVADFIASLKINGTIDTAGLYPITEIYDLDFADGTLTFSPKDGGQDIGLRPPYLNFGEEVLGTDLILTARDETSDPVSATVTMGYAGEAQTASLDLEDAAVYDAYTNGAATERGASVYFQGGKVYATIAPVDDPATGEVDESVVHAVTVSANMGTGRDPGYWATSSLIGSGSGYTLASVDTVVPGVFYLRLRYAEDAGAYDHPTTGWAGGGKTLGQIALDIAALDFVANAYYVENPSGGLTLVVEYEPVAGRTYASGQLVVDVGGVTQTNGGLYIESGSGNAEKTAENLVAAINAQTGEGGDLAGLIGSAAYDSQTGKITLTAAAPGKEMFSVSDVRMDYQGVKQLATIALDADVSYAGYQSSVLGGTEATRTADVYFEGGQVYVTIVPRVADGAGGYQDGEPVTINALMGVDAAVTAQNLVEAINAETVEGSLSGIVGVNGASLLDGVITLEAAVAGREAFRVDDVRMDYAGVVQTASVSLDSLASYVEYSFSDDAGAPVTIREGAQPATYFEGGKAYITIDNVSRSELTTVADSQQVRLSVANGETLAEYLDRGGLPADLIIGDNGESPVTYADYLNEAGIEFSLSGEGGFDRPANDDKIVLQYTDGGQSYFFLLDADGGGSYDDTLVNIFATDLGVDAPTLMAFLDASQELTTVETFSGFELGAEGTAATLSDGDRLEFEFSLLGNGTVVSYDYSFTFLASGEGGYTVISTTFVPGEAPQRQLWEGNLSHDPTTDDFAAVVAALLNANLAASNIAVSVGTEGAGLRTVSFDVSAAEGLALRLDAAPYLASGTEVTIEALMGVDAAETTANLVAAINAQTGPEGSLDGIVRGAVVDLDGSITLTGAQPGTETFRVSDVRLDYAGVNQIAQVDFTNLANEGAIEYFSGGDLSLTLRATDASGVPTGEDIVISVPMTDGEDVDALPDAAGSVAALVSALQGEIVEGRLTGLVGAVSESNGVITLSSASAVQQQFAITAATVSDPGEPEVTTVHFSTDNADYFAAGSDPAGSAGTVSVTVLGQTYSANMVDGDALASAQALLAVLQDPETGLDTAQVAVSLDVDTVEVGSPVYVSSLNNQWVGGGATRTYSTTAIVDNLEAYGGFTVIEATLNSDPFVTDERYTSLSDWAVDAQAYWRINDPSASVSYDAETGVLTVTTTEYVGQLGIPVLRFVSVDVQDFAFTFTGQQDDLDLGISGAASVDAVQQVSEIGFDAGMDDADFIAGIGREVSVTVAGQSFSLDGDSRLEILQDLEAQLLAAIAADTEGTGIAGVLQAGGVALDEETLTLSLTARYGEADPLNVSDFTRAGFDDTVGSNVRQEVALGFTLQYLNSLVGTTKTLSFELGKTVVDYTVGATQTTDQIVAGIAAALEAADLVESATVDGRIVTVTASFWGPNVLGTVSSGEENTVTLREGPIEITTGFFAEELVAGTISFLADSPETVGTARDVVDGVDLATADPLAEGAVEVLTTAKPVTVEDVVVTNPGFDAGDDSSFFGDAAQDASFKAVGVKQSYTNPNDGYDAVNGSALVNDDSENAGNVTLYGDDALSGGVDGTGSYTGDGVGQTYTNPTSPYGTVFASLANPYALEYQDGEGGTDLAANYWRDAGDDLYDSGNYLYVDDVEQSIWDVAGGSGSLAWGRYSFETFANGTLLSVQSLSASAIRIEGEMGADGSGSVESGELALTGFTGLRAFYTQTYGSVDPSLVKIFITDATSPVLSAVPSDTDQEFFELTGLGDASRFTYAMFAGDNMVDDGYRYTQAEITAFVEALLSAGNGGLSDRSFYGDDALTGVLGEDGSFNGTGVTQGYTNPDSGYDATAGSPQFNDASSNGGDTTLYGSDPGYYADDGLYTSYLDGGTQADPAQGDGEGANLYTGLGEDDLGAVIDTDATVSVGESASTSNLGEDAVSNDQAGFASFSWDAAMAEAVSSGNAAPDVIYNFQVGGWAGEDYVGDTIALEGALLESTHEGTVTGLQADVQLLTQELTVDVGDTYGDEQGEPFLDWKYGSVTFDTSDITGVFQITNDPTVSVRLVAGSEANAIGVSLGLQGQLFETVGDLGQAYVDWINSRFEADIASYEVVSGDLKVSVADGYQFNGSTTGFRAVYEQSTPLEQAFDLSADEYAVVASADSSLDASAIADADQVATLLDSLFDFSGSSANGELNTSIFAVTAQDDPSVTAIWAHRQSSADDATIEAVELYQLATVHTLPGESLDEFSVQNFGVMPLV